MISKPTISLAFSRKVLCITLTLIVGFGLTAGGVMADKCHGGPGCIVCAGLMHPQLPGMDMDLGMMAPQGCQPPIPDGTCSYQVNPSPKEFQGIISSVRPEKIDNAYEATSAFDGDRGDSFGALRLPTRHFAPGQSAPIFLINQSLLC